jgi:type II secretion system protein N
LNLKPDYNNLLNGYIPFNFQGELPFGEFKGQIGFSFRSGLKDSFIFLDSNALDLGGFEAIPVLLKRDLNGKMTGSIRVHGNLNNIFQCNGNGFMSLANGAIGTRLGFPGLEKIPFDRMEFEFTLDQGLVNIKKATIQGAMFSGDFNGHVKLKDALDKSRVSVDGTVKPGKEIRDNPFFGRLIGKALKGKDTIPLQVRGTLRAPKIKRREN